MILDDIVSHKRQEITKQRRRVPLPDLCTRAAEQAPPIDLVAALRGGRGKLIAEIKRASPSRGVLCPGLDPPRLAATYVQNGAAALSVLTDEHFFQGKLDYIPLVRQTVGAAVPILRKDFILDPYQVHEARAAGADAILLIAAILGERELSDLLALAGELGMAALVEVHDEDEIERTLPARPRLVGINQRNLRDFTIDHTAFGRLRPLLPAEITVVAESGVRNAGDVRRLSEAGANGVLVGEALVTADDVAARVRELANAAGVSA